MSFVEVAAARRFSPEKMQKVALFETERSILDIYCVLPGQRQKLHTHAANDKYYYVLEGRGRFRIGDEERELTPGWAALARPGVEHGLVNDSPEPLVVLVFQAPKPF